MTGQEGASGPDLTAGLALTDIEEDKPFGGHVGDKPVVLVRRGNQVFAIGGSCTHYGGPLAEGIVVGDTIRCPWHHACFDLHSGEATCAPALDPVERWDVEIVNGNVRVVREHAKGDGADPRVRNGKAAASSPMNKSPRRIVIVGAGAAAEAAAEMLRREGFSGSLTMITAEPTEPVDRPNLSKDYLAGNAEPEWVPLRPPEFHEKHGITVRRGSRVDAVDVASGKVILDDRTQLEYDRLLLATGADPVSLQLPGGDLPHVHYLRTRADSEAIIEAAKRARRACIMGASFIGLEVAASLRERNLDVVVVAPELLPLGKVLGRELGAFVQRLHEDHGVKFRLGSTATQIESTKVLLDNGETIDSDIVVIGVGVRPAVALAEQAGLNVNRGVVVDEFLETSAQNVFAAGDIARWPDARTGEPTRVEHWVHAERMGQTAARNMLRDKSERERFSDIPFFWSAHYDATIRYVGHAEKWDDVLISGSVDARDAAVGYRKDGRILAVATIGRDMFCLEAEAAMERGDDRALAALFER